jgi:outer membrane receptor for ferrienterochelin and colicins
VTDDVLNAHTSFLIMENLLTLGGELRDETLKSPTIDKGEDDATHSALFLQDEIELFDRLMLTLGFRWDHHEFFGSETSPRIYAVYKATDNLTFKGGYGQAFNAPTIKQVSAGYKAMTGPHTFYGNPDVDAETSDNYEVGAEYVTGRFYAKAFFFDIEIADMIEWRKLDPACRYPDRCEYIADNIEEARTRGVETEIGVDLSYGFNISANYTYLDAKDTENDERLEGRPRHSANGKLKYVYEPWRLSANLRFDYVGSQILNEEEVPSYTLWHFAVRKKFLDNFELKLGVDNIGDERLADKSDAFDYEERGRFFYGGLRMFF